LSTSQPGQPTATSLQIELDGDNYWLRAGDGDIVWLIGPATDFFQHVAVTFDAAAAMLAVYLNGQLVQSDVWTGSPDLGFQVLNLGVDRDGANPYTGLIDEVQVFQRALSADDVYQTFLAGADGLCKNHSPVAVAVASPNPAEATGSNGATVLLDGTGSTDPDGDALAYTWQEGTPTLGTGATLSVRLALGSHPITLTVDDGRGGRSSNEVTVVVRDATAPLLSGVPTDMTLEATGPAGAIASWTAPTATDAVDGAVAVICAPASGSTFPLGTTPVDCSATDAHGNTGSNTFSVIVHDTAPPLLTVPANLTVEATSAAGAVVTFNATATDVVDGPRAVSCTPGWGSTFGITTTTVTCSAIDARGNSGSTSFTVTVRDTTGPVLALPVQVVAEATSPLGAAVSYAVSATDAVSGVAPVTCVPASASGFAIGSTQVSCSAIDATGHVTNGGFPVIVRDTTAPAVQITSPLPDAMPTGATIDVQLQASDIVGVAGVTVNGVAATQASGTPQAGTWRATVSIALPVAPGGALHFDARASDAMGNAGVSTLLVDADGIPSAMDRTRIGNVDQSSTFSNDFNNGVTAGTLTRNGWVAKLSAAPTAGGVRTTISGSGTIAVVSACVGAAKEVRLDAIGETADVTCNPSTGTITVKAVSAVPQIELREQVANGTWQQFILRTAQTMSVGSPATASAGNVGAIDAQILQIDDAGQETVIGTYQLTPGASVDVSVMAGGVGHDDQVYVDVVRGSVVVKRSGVTRTLGPGESATLPIDRTPPSVSCGAADATWYAENVSITCVAQDAGVGLARRGDATFRLTTAVEPNAETATAETSIREVCDLGGNCAVAGPIGGIRVDRKPPTVTITAPAAKTYPVNGSTMASYTCSDAGSGVVSCAGPVASGAAVDTSTVGKHVFTVTARDAVGHAMSDSVTYTVVPANQPGRMVGEGEVNAAGVESHFAFRVVERTTGSEGGDFQCWFEGTPTGERGAPRRHRFEANRIASVTFTNDPAVRPGRGARPMVDTVVVTGNGRWDGADGYTFEARAVDAGEPGRGHDQMSVTIRDARGAIVAGFAGTLTGGNIQSSR
jgi:hypothetical protein